MSAGGQEESFVERNWFWFLIGFGLVFAACIIFFAPHN